LGGGLGEAFLKEAFDGQRGFLDTALPLRDRSLADAQFARQHILFQVLKKTEFLDPIAPIHPLARLARRKSFPILWKQELVF